MSAIEILSSPYAVFAGLLQFPVVLSLAGVPLVYAVCAADETRRPLLRTAMALYGVLALAGLALMGVGKWMVFDSAGHLPDSAWAWLGGVMDMVYPLWLFGIVVLVLLALGSMPVRGAQQALLGLALAAALLTAGWCIVLWQSHARLVYGEGLGVSSPAPPRAPVQDESISWRMEPARAEEDAALPTPRSDAPPNPPAQPPAAAAASAGTPAAPIEPPAPAEIAVPAPEPVRQPAEAPKPTSPLEPEPPAASKKAYAGPNGDESLSPGVLPIEPIRLDEADKVSYIRDVQPILAAHCYACHGAQEAKGGLDATTLPALIEGGKTGPAVVPGRPGQSLLVARIRGIIEPRMPKDQPPLDSTELHLLRRWIVGGAEDDTDSPPQRPAVPTPEE